MKKLFELSFFVLSVITIYGQSIVNSNYTGKRQQFVKQEPGHFYYTLQTSKDSIKTYDLDLLETENVIVEFKTPPMFKIKKTGLLKLTASDYKNLFNKFSRDLSLLVNNMTKIKMVLKSSPAIKKEFYKLFTGVNIEAPKGLLASISSLSYVKRIFKNNRVYPLENYIQSEYDYSIKSGNFSNLKGDSIVVGEIDTGIDYMNPELGGGFGPGYKVIGGYDIINNDDDPMDDMGHGTHVAGIIAADGDSLVGIAPHSKLMAFKVFSPTKMTFDSDIITAIERAADPNNDDSIEDKVNVVNMSIGGNGNPEDPVSTAVDNASGLGIVFCVAVGNSGNFFTISSPGNARSAIGVGASDYENKIAFFSSKGPTKKTYLIKPDVLAPGVNVYSTYLNNTFVKMSGTSMATPYVAGICALLKQIHKNWSPEKIKSAIMITATPLSTDVMEQGAGIVNPAIALDEQTTITPSSLSFGFCDSQEDVWTKTDTLLLKNNSDNSKEYSINISDPLIQVFPSNLSVRPNDSAYIYIKLTVDNNKVNFLQSGSFSYSGNLNISDGTDQLHIPWAFVKAPRIFISFDKPVMDFIITDKNNIYSSFVADWDDDYTHAELILPSSTYDITSFFIQFSDDSLGSTQNIKIVNNENVTVDNGTNISINSVDAKNQVYFEGTDESGKELAKKSNWSGGFFLLYPDYTKMKSASFSIDSGTVISFSNMSQDYSLLFGEFEKDFSTNKAYVYQHDIVKGVNSDIHTKGNPDNNYVSANIDIYLSPFTESHKLYFGNIVWIANLGYGSNFNDPVELNAGLWKGTIYITENKSNQYGFSTNIFEPLTDDINSRYSWFQTDLFKLRNDSIGFGPYSDSTDTKYMVPNGGKITIGNGISVPNSNIFYQYKSTDFVYLVNPGFQGQFGEYRYSDLVNTTYKLFKSNNIIRQGNFFDDSGINLDELNAGNYRLEMKNSNYTIEKERGTLSMNFYFKIEEQNNGLPPIIQTLQILNSEKIPTSLLEKNEKANILFSVAYFSADDSINMFVKEQNSNEWKLLTVKYLHYEPYYGFLYSADLSNYTDFDSAALDLKIDLTNGITEKSEIVWEPLIGIGKFVGSLKPLSIDVEVNNLPDKYKLYTNYPNPFNPTTTIIYSIPKKSNVVINVYDILGREIANLVNEEKQTGNYQVEFNAANLPSGVYFYRIQAGSFSQVRKMLLIK